MNSVTATTDHNQEIRSRDGTPTWEIAWLYPNQGEWSESEYLALGTNRMIEFTDGRLEFLPMPNRLHQWIVRFLFKQLDAFVERSRLPGEVYFAPLPVRLWKGRFREPDVLYVTPERLAGFRRAPDGVDLAIEVVSEREEDRQRDLVTKRHEYAQAGIPEYWIVDPQERRITVLTLDGNEYRVYGEFGPGETAESVLLPGFTVAVDAVFAAEQNQEQSTTDN